LTANWTQNKIEETLTPNRTYLGASDLELHDTLRLLDLDVLGILSASLLKEVTDIVDLLGLQYNTHKILHHWTQHSTPTHTHSMYSTHPSRVNP
jgi:hypothetical protein